MIDGCIIFFERKRVKREKTIAYRTPDDSKLDRTLILGIS